MNHPIDVVLDAMGNVYVLDSGNRRLRRIDATGKTSTFVGNDATGAFDGLGTAATLGGPLAITDAPGGGWLLVDGNTVRKVTLQGQVTTVFNDWSGLPAEPNTGTGLLLGVAAASERGIYVADPARVYRIELGLP